MKKTDRFDDCRERLQVWGPGASKAENSTGAGVYQRVMNAMDRSRSMLVVSVSRAPQAA